MSDTKKNFLGIPIEGEPQHSSRQSVVQLTQEDLAPLLLAVLADPIIEAVGWTQYTPYFNDGDACEFDVHTPYFVCAGDSTDTDDDEYDEYEYEENNSVDYGTHPVLGKREFSWTGTYGMDRARVFGPYEGDHEVSYDRARALSDALNSGAFNDVLLSAFGDHAKVRVTPAGIQVDSYEHD